MTCIFFGHRNATKEIEPTLRSTLIDLIENHDVNLFYVGNHGNFDGMVRRVLKDLAGKYDITYYVVLAYMPGKHSELSCENYFDTLLPDGIEFVPKRFAITYCNKWMIEQSDYVVTYVTNQIGSGAAQFKEMAEKRGKIVINLSYDKQRPL